MDTAVFDVDGTLVDSNYQHTLAWFRAFQQFDITVAAREIHRAIGMGRDQLVAAVAGTEVEKADGDGLRAALQVAVKKVDVPAIAVLTGRFSEGELRDAGAAQVFHDLREFRDNLDRTALDRPS